MTAEAPHVNVANYAVFPYAQHDDARGRMSHAETRFGKPFHVRKLGEGYILANDEMILDARGFVTSCAHGVLEVSVERFYIILKESKEHELPRASNPSATLQV
ncbi:MAG TPA: hypothetical protein VLJ21_01925 [Candidatus Binatia bacterium]|nr:hypothetical protein [Candidatus Binatia bacterium]